MATTSADPHVNLAIGGAWFTPEDAQGTPMNSFTADGGANTTTAVTFDTTSGATQNNNAASIAAERFQGLQVVFDAATTTAALQGKAYNISASSAPAANIVTLTVDTMPSAPVGTDTFKVVGRLPTDFFIPNTETDDLPRDFMRDTLDAPSSIKGLSFASGSFEMELPGLVTPLGDGATPSKDRFGNFLETFFGERRASAGSTVTGAGSTTTVIDVTDGTKFAEDDVVIINGEARVVTDVDTAATPDNITLHEALSAIPSASDVVYNTESFKPYDTGHTTGTIFVRHDDRLHEIRGCIGSIGLMGTVSGKAKLKFDFSGEWEIGQTTDGASLAGYQVNKAPIAVKTWRASHFGSSRMVLNSIEYATGSPTSELTDGDAGRRFFIRQRDATCKAVFRYQTKAAKTWQTSGTKAVLLVVGGSGAGDAFGVYGQGQIKANVGETDQNKTLYNDATFSFYDDQTSNDDKKPRLLRG